MKKGLYISGMIGVFSLGVATLAHAGVNEVDYCTHTGGKVKTITAEFQTADPAHPQKGLRKQFCTFKKDGGYIVVGLDAYASKHANIAATYIEKLGNIPEGSYLMAGKYSNPSWNLCKNLGGAIAGYHAQGAFTDNTGQSDVCVFGDDSMVSSWSLYYMATGRDHYNEVKENVRSEPIQQINLPNV